MIRAASLHGAHPPAGSPLRAAGAWATLTAVTLGTVAADLASKAYAFAHLIPGEPVELTRTAVLDASSLDPGRVSMLIPHHRPVVAAPGLLEFTLVLNPGAVFGMGAGQRWFFVLFTVIALGFGGWVFARWTGARDRWAHAAIGMLLGGGLGNLYDRLIYGCVRDFIHPLPGLMYPGGVRLLGNREVWPYVSNVADLVLIVGIGVLMVHLWRRKAPPGQPTGG